VDRKSTLRYSEVAWWDMFESVLLTGEHLLDTIHWGSGSSKRDGCQR